MQIRTRIFLVFVATTTLGFMGLLHWLADDLRPRYKEAQEELLVDMANVLAEMVAEQSQVGADGVPHLGTEVLHDSFPAIAARRLQARIYALDKDRVDVRVYVTDAQGQVVFDSDRDRDLGKDYSQWIDISRTLKGEYGARSTNGDPLFPKGSVMYVAAPITLDGRLLGVISVGKPTRNAERFLDAAIENITLAGLLAAATAVLVALILYAWVSRPLQALTNFAHAVQTGKRVSLPRLGRNEIGRVGEAMVAMRSALDGKSYIENYVQALTHELKSPLAAIRGAAELLQEPMNPAERAHFVNNIQSETARAQELIDRLLELAAIEGRPGLEAREPVVLRRVVQEAVDGLEATAKSRGIIVETNLVSVPTVLGDPFLLHQAVRNLLENAIGFSPAGCKVKVELREDENDIELEISDRGPGIPEYAKTKVFDRFYSLPRANGRRGTGLGLSFVQEIMALHGGGIELENVHDGSGCCARLRMRIDRT